MTEGLRLLGVGRRQQQDEAQQQQPLARLAPGDVQGVLARIAVDYDRSYFVTGVIDDAIYDAQCRFEDPTVSFEGLELWKRNLQLLVPFLVQPRIELLSLAEAPGLGPQGARQLQAEWTLETGLALPWRPYVSVRGRTVYLLNEAQNQVVRHTESWDVSAWQALLQVVTPAPAKWPQR